MTAQFELIVVEFQVVEEIRQTAFQALVRGYQSMFARSCTRSGLYVVDNNVKEAFNVGADWSD